MDRLKRAATVGLLAFGGALVLTIVRGVATGAWLPLGAVGFIAVSVGVVGAVLDLMLRGPKPKKADRHAVAPALRSDPPRTAIVFRQQIPPAFDPRHLSYFGGRPTVPPSFIWPRWTHDGASEALHFILQIDCAAVPAAARPDGFPPRGVLYFFLDLRWGHSNGFSLVYAEDVTGPLAPAPVPADLAAAYGPEARHAWRWLTALDDAAARCPNLLPKWPFDPVSVTIPPALVAQWQSELDAESENPVFWWPDVEPMHAVLLAAQADPLARAVAAKPDPLARPFATYPQDWRAIEIGAGLLLDHANGTLRYPKSHHRLRSLTAEEVQAMSDRIGREVREWLARAAEHAPFAAPPAETRDAFWSWLESWSDLSTSAIGNAATLAIEASLVESAEAAARLPAAAIDRIRARHALAMRTQSGIFAATPDRMLAPPSSVQGNQEEIAQTHLLLLELSSNDGIGHHFGEGVYQFWIAPDDLRHRRFDRVVLTTDAY